MGWILSWPLKTVNSFLLTVISLQSTLHSTDAGNGAGTGPREPHYRRHKMDNETTTRRIPMALCAAALGLAAGMAHAQRTPLLVYTALETDSMKAYKTAFEKANPDIEIKWVRDSTGIITAKLMAEKANPQTAIQLRLPRSVLISPL